MTSCTLSTTVTKPLNGHSDLSVNAGIGLVFRHFHTVRVFLPEQAQILLLNLVSFSSYLFV